MPKRLLLLLTSILLLAAALRIGGLTRQPLWLDELFTTAFASALGSDTVLHIMVSDVHPPMYYAQLNLWMRTVGTQDFLVRLDSAFWGMLAVALLYRVSRRHVGDRVALVAALLLAVSACAVFYAQQARMYAMLITLGLGVWWSLDNFFTRPLTLRVRGTYLGVTLLFLYSQGVALLLLPAIGVYGLAWAWSAWRANTPEWQGRFGRWLQWTFLIGILYVPWMFLAANMGVSHTEFPDLSVLAATMTELLFGYGTPCADALQYALLVLVGVTLVLALFNARLRPVILAFVLAPLVFNIVVSIVLRPIWLTRSIAFVLPFILLAIAQVIVGAGQLKLPLYRRVLIGGVVLVLLGATFYQTATQRYTWTLDNSRAYVAERAQSGDTILFPTEVLYWLWSWHYVEPGVIRTRLTNEVTTAEGVHVAHFADRSLNEFFHAGQTYWVISAVEFPQPDLSRCEANFSADERWQIDSTWIRRVVINADAAAPVCD